VPKYGRHPISDCWD